MKDTKIKYLELDSTKKDEAEFWRIIITFMVLCGIGAIISIYLETSL